MAAQAASELIFFVGSVVISAALVGVFFGAVTQMSDSIRTNADASASTLESSITVLNDPAHVAYNNTSGNFTLWVKNTGSRPLSVNHTIMIFDGRTVANDSYVTAFAGNYTAWSPQVTVVFTITGTSLTPSTDHFIKVIAQFGASDSQEFYW